jgi:hypothetical protein
VSYNRRSTILDLKNEGVLKLWHDYRLGHTLDLSGNANHGTFAPVINQPFSRQGLAVPLGGRGVATPSIDLTGTNKIGFVFGARQIQNSANQIFIEFSPDHNAVTTGFICAQNASSQLLFQAKGDLGSTVATPAIQDVLGDGQYSYVGASYDKSLTLAGIKIYHNGDYLTAAGGSVANTNNFGNHSLFFGARNQSTLPVNAVLQGIILVSRVLTADEHRAVYKELAYP